MVLFGEMNQAVFDWPWSAVHLSSGLIIGFGLITIRPTMPVKKFWLVGVGLLVLWELVEIILRYYDIHHHQAIAPLKQAVGSFAFGRESKANVMGDIIIGSFGLLLGQQLRKKWTIRHDQAGRENTTV